MNSKNLRHLLALSIVVLFIVGCAGDQENDYAIRVNEAEPNVICEIKAGAEITLSLAAQSFPADETYLWEDSLDDSVSGTFSRPDARLTNYTAPNFSEDRPVTIVVSITSADNSTKSKEITCNIKGDPSFAAKEESQEVVEADSATPTMPEPEPTDTNIPQPTDTPRPLPGNTPTFESPIASSTPIKTIEEAISLFQERGHIIVGVREDAPPFGSLQEGNFVGFDIDIAHEFAERWLGDGSLVELVAISAAERIDAAETKRVDFVIAALTFTPQRCSDAACSQVYFQDGARLLVRADSGIQGPVDLDNRLVSVIPGTTAEQTIIGLQQDYPYTTPPRLIYKPDRESAIEAVRAGEVDAYSTDGKILEAYQDGELIVVGGEFTEEPYTIATNKNDLGIRQLINATLQEMKRDGWYQTIYETHFGCETPYLISVEDGADIPQYVKRDVSPPSSSCEDVFDISEVGTWMVTPGQTLGGIAKDYYGDYNFYKCIQIASDLDNPNLLHAGQSLTLPPVQECVEIVQ